jgi:hypothetical protein
MSIFHFGRDLGSGVREMLFTSIKARLAAVVIGATATAGAAVAHHSFAMYDNENQMKVTGTVTQFQWTNPHVYIELKNDPGAAKVDHFTIECASPGILVRAGWKFNMIKPGDKITVVVAPLRNGDPGALLKGVKLSDGRVLDNGGPAGKAALPL